MVNRFLDAYPGHGLLLLTAAAGLLDPRAEATPPTSPLLVDSTSSSAKAAAVGKATDEVDCCSCHTTQPSTTTDPPSLGSPDDSLHLKRRSDHPRDMGIVCALFAETGVCPVSKCPYMHVTAATRRPVPTSVCAFYSRYRCRRMDCPFFHQTQDRLDALIATGATEYCPLMDGVPRRDPLQPLSVDTPLLPAAELSGVRTPDVARAVSEVQQRLLTAATLAVTDRLCSAMAAAERLTQDHHSSRNRTAFKKQPAVSPGELKPSKPAVVVVDPTPGFPAQTASPSTRHNAPQPQLPTNSRSEGAPTVLHKAVFSHQHSYRLESTVGTAPLPPHPSVSTTTCMQPPSASMQYSPQTIANPLHSTTPSTSYFSSNYSAAVSLCPPTTTVVPLPWYGQSTPPDYSSMPQHQQFHHPYPHMPSYPLQHQQHQQQQPLQFHAPIRNHLQEPFPMMFPTAQPPPTAAAAAYSPYTTVVILTAPAAPPLSHPTAPPLPSVPQPQFNSMLPSPSPSSLFLPTSSQPPLPHPCWFSTEYAPTSFSAV